MNHFYLLRANREAGPFTRAELKTHGLLSTYLLWVDGESKEWKHPSDIEGLDMSFSEQSKQEPSAVKKDFSPLVSVTYPLPQRPVSAEEGFTSAADSRFSPNNTSEAIFQKRRSSAPVYTVGARLFGFVVVLIGLLLCGFVVINMVKQFAARPAPQSEAVLINAETLPASNTAHTAQAPPAQSISPTAPSVEPKDSLPSEANFLKKELKTTANTKAPKTKAKMVSAAPDNTQTAQADGVNETPAEAPEEKPEPVKAVNNPPALQLSANDYKVGLFGGVSNLEITVANPSGQTIAKAVVNIDYLKPNGNVVKTQTVTVESIGAGASKTIQVPPSSRGVKVRYQVTGIETKE